MFGLPEDSCVIRVFVYSDAHSGVILDLELTSQATI